MTCQGRYDRALREAYNADRKLRAAGQGSFVDHHDIAQIIGESQLCLGQDAEADKSFQKSLQSIKARLATHHGSLDLRECQKTMQAENIFTEFVQLDEYSDGTGIGLSIARSFARHMNGDVILDTSYTGGSRFVMTLGL